MTKMTTPKDNYSSNIDKNTSEEENTIDTRENVNNEYPSLSDDDGTKLSEEHNDKDIPVYEKVDSPYNTSVDYPQEPTNGATMSQPRTSQPYDDLRGTPYANSQDDLHNNPYYVAPQQQSIVQHVGVPQGGYHTESTKSSVSFKLDKENLFRLLIHSSIFLIGLFTLGTFGVPLMFGVMIMAGLGLSQLFLTDRSNYTYIFYDIMVFVSLTLLAISTNIYAPSTTYFILTVGTMIVIEGAYSISSKLLDFLMRDEEERE